MSMSRAHLVLACANRRCKVSSASEMQVKSAENSATSKIDGQASKKAVSVAIGDPLALRLQDAQCAKPKIRVKLGESKGPQASETCSLSDALVLEDANLQDMVDLSDIVSALQKCKTAGAYDDCVDAMRDKDCFADELIIDAMSMVPQPFIAE